MPDLLTENLQLFRPSDHSPRNAQETRQIQTRVRLCVPKQYQHEPIISDLILKFGLTVNIAGALLGANSRTDGWFDLELQGKASKIHDALVYLNDLSVQIWYEPYPQEGW